MPRRGRSPSPSLPARRPAPARAPVAAPPAPSGVGQPRQPGLMAQMASTAVGVGIGSAVGHTIGHAMTGGSGGGAAAAPEEYPQQAQQQQSGGACAEHLQDFLQCAQNNANDLSLCYGFNEALKECKARNAL